MVRLVKSRPRESTEEKLDLESAWKKLSTESFEEGKSALYSIMAKQKIAEQIEDDVIIQTCELHGYQYAVITPDDIVIPPDIEHDFI